MSQPILNPTNYVQTALDNRTPIYVRNKTGGSGRPMMALVVDYPTPGSALGRSHNVPPTSIPYDITGHVTHNRLRDSDSFFRYITGGQIEIVPVEQAEHELKDPSVRQAWSAANQEANNTYVARRDEQQKEREARSEERAQSEGLGEAVDAMVAIANPELAKRFGRIHGNAVPQRSDMEGGRNMKLVNIERRAKAGTMNGRQAVQELTSILGQLSDADLKQIMGNPLWPAEAQEWATQRLSFRQEEQPAAHIPAGQEEDYDPNLMGHG